MGSRTEKREVGRRGGERKEEREGVERTSLIFLKDALTFPCGCIGHKLLQY